MLGSDAAPWSNSFQVEGDPSGHIVIKQVDGNVFELGSKIIFLGEETGLESKLDAATIDALRWVDPERLPQTDLASVPLPLRWLVSNYGVHTPAALIHDWMIDEGPPVVGGLTPQFADRYFRFMLRDLRVQWIRRWMMWSAVALRTRWATGWRHRVLLAIWMISALAGIGVFVAGVINRSPVLVIAPTLGPLVFGLLWGRQYAAGLVAAYNAPWILPPTVLGAIGYGIYTFLEWVLSRLTRGGSGSEEYGYRDF
jgi:hypothetical protein